MKARMTKEKFLSITHSQGYFDISLKWRFDYLRRIASKLIAENKIFYAGRVNRANRYLPIKYGV